jgi:hypothetical protein
MFIPYSPFEIEIYAMISGISTISMIGRLSRPPLSLPLLKGET